MQRKTGMLDGDMQIESEREARSYLQLPAPEPDLISMGNKEKIIKKKIKISNLNLADINLANNQDTKPVEKDQLFDK